MSCQRLSSHTCPFASHTAGNSVPTCGLRLQPSRKTPSQLPPFGWASHGKATDPPHVDLPAIVWSQRHGQRRHHCLMNIKTSWYWYCKLGKKSFLYIYKNSFAKLAVPIPANSHEIWLGEDTVLVGINWTNNSILMNARNWTLKASA